ncbi:MAG: hypothetical protein WC582_03820 [Patescibacteria group bacterium]
MKFNNFETISFPQHPKIVYILGIEFKGKFIPFYVGQTSRDVGRFGDYVSAKFSASTDFKVGEAVRCFKKQGYSVKIKLKNSNNKEKEEKDLLIILRRDVKLLNDLEGYNYKTASENEERQKIHLFIDKFLEQANIKY